MIDMMNKKFGYLKVIEKDEETSQKKPSIYWICLCEACGKTVSVDGRQLRKKKNPQISCGCMRGRKNKINWIGIKQGRLLVLEETNKRDASRHIIYKCKCDCGNICEISSKNLQSGTQSCGCLIKERITEVNSEKIINKKFNSLLVLEATNERNYKGNIIYKCKCDCGNITYASTPNLVNGYKKSCGCESHQSIGVKNIISILEKNKINFVKEKRFSDCRNEYPLPFDFYVNNQYLIEYDGEQHFKPINSWGGEEGFKQRQLNDNIKNKYCLEKNIPLIRIPYTHSNILLEDLIPTTSTFLINKGLDI